MMRYVPQSIPLLEDKLFRVNQFSMHGNRRGQEITVHKACYPKLLGSYAGILSEEPGDG